MKLTGAQAIVQSLLNEGVDLVFGYPGGAIMPLYDALYDVQDKLKHVLVRHEQGATHAAQGYAAISGKAGVVIATSGPGATNLVTGLADAMLDSEPLVCITGQVASHLIGSDAFQEVDIIGITTPITKWNFQITSPDEIADTFAKAFHIATTGRPGPVLIDITKDAQFGTCEFSYKKEISIPSFKPTTIPNPKQLEKAAALLNTAERPYMLVGHGILISKAESELAAFAEKSGIPVASTLLGLSALPTAHPNYVGYLGMHGNYGPNVLTNKADVILAVGMRFDDRVTGRLADYAKQAKIIHVDIDPAELGKNVHTEVPIVADAKIALSELTKLVESRDHSGWFDEFKKYADEEHTKVIAGRISKTEESIKMPEVINALSEKTNGEAIIVADVGQHQMEAARYYKFAKSHSFVTSGGAGTMGYALPASLGARMATDREVFAIIGDGCFQMNIQELATVAQENVPVKIIVLNNGYLGMVRQWQQLFFDKRYSFVELKNPNFVKVAEGFGIAAERVESHDQLSDALDRLINSKSARLLEVVVAKEGNVFPMIPSGASVEEVLLEEKK